MVEPVVVLILVLIAPYSYPHPGIRTHFWVEITLRRLFLPFGSLYFVWVYMIFSLLFFFYLNTSRFSLELEPPLSHPILLTTPLYLNF